MSSGRARTTTRSRPPRPLTITLDAAQAGADLDIRRHGLSQGGIDDAPLTGPVIEKVKALGPRTLRFFVQEYFGMMEAPGRYRWATIDAMLKSVAATGAQAILALCMKPPCLYGRIDHRDTVPSDWRHWDDFLSAMARHFAEDLKLPGLWYEVANEPDIGEAGGCPYLFTPDGYAEYYAHTVRAVLRGDPTAKVGGPALAGGPGSEAGAAMTTALARRAQRENLPVDFYSWHSYRPDGQGFARQVAQAKQALAALGPPLSSATTVLDEWNISWVCALEFGEFLQAAFAVEAVYWMLEGGLDVSNYYHIMDMLLAPSKWRGWFSPEGLRRMEEFWVSDYRGLHLLRPSGEAAAGYAAFKMLYEMEGQQLAVPRPSHNVGALASRGPRGCHLLVWNYHHQDISPAEVEAQVVNLPRGRVVERHWCLGGELTDLECVRAMRGGGMKLQHQAAHADGSPFRKRWTLLPYSVHLLSLQSDAD